MKLGIAVNSSSMDKNRNKQFCYRRVSILPWLISIRTSCYPSYLLVYINQNVMLSILPVGVYQSEHHVIHPTCWCISIRTSCYPSYLLVYINQNIMLSILPVGVYQSEHHVIHPTCRCISIRTSYYPSYLLVYINQNIMLSILPVGVCQSEHPNTFCRSMYMVYSRGRANTIKVGHVDCCICFIPENQCFSPLRAISIQRSENVHYFLMMLRKMS